MCYHPCSERNPLSSNESNGLALLFDLDGVILDSNPMHVECWKAYLRRCGVPVPPDLGDRLFGRRNAELASDLFGLTADDPEVLRHGAEKERLFREMMLPVFTENLVPGVVTFLEAHCAVPKAVASNAEPANIDFVLDNAGIRDRFVAVVDGHQVTRPKPYPDIYLRAAELVGAAPHNCVVFEDSYSGIEAALAAGTRVVALRTTHEEFPAVDLAVDHFLDPKLEPWLRAQKPRG